MQFWNLERKKILATQYAACMHGYTPPFEEKVTVAIRLP
jgi:hypothetical protein